MKKSTKNSKSKASKQHMGPGRPKYTPSFPRSREWTFTDWMDANDVDTRLEVNGKPNPAFGKGPNCSMLTLRKNMERDMYFHKPGKRPIAANRTKANPRSQIVILRDVTSEPNSESGLGRRAMLYSLRAKAVGSTGAKRSAPRKGAELVSTVTIAPDLAEDAEIVAGPPSEYELVKAALLAPEPVQAAPVIEESHLVPEALTLPAVTIVPDGTPAPVADAAPAVAPEATAPATAQ